jgi:hypothetical protein
LPETEIVYVRNVFDGLKNKIVFEIQIETTNPDTNQVEIFHDLISGKPYYEWVKMPLSLALKRLEKHAKKYTTLDELITEVYLTEVQINKLKFNLLNRIKSVLKRLLRRERF